MKKMTLYGAQVSILLWCIASLGASESALKMEIVAGGYNFHTAYQLHSLLPSHCRPAKLKVDVTIGQDTIFCKNLRPFRGVPETKAKFRLRNILTEVDAYYLKNGKTEIERTHIRTSNLLPLRLLLFFF